MPNGQQRLSRRAAAALRDELTAALAGRQSFIHTSGEHRPDGRYVVSRRSADSAGNAKTFARFAELVELYEALPDRFDAEAVGAAARRAAADDERSGLTGGRRHLVLRHLAEHPAFDCELVAEQPLTAQKISDDSGEVSAAPVEVTTLPPE